MHALPQDNVVEKAVENRPVQRYSGGSLVPSKDMLVSESPLQISVSLSGVSKPLGILLRTPGDDENLVIGWLLGEAIISSFEAVIGVTADENEIEVQLDQKVVAASDLNGRRFTISSSCGLCGRETLEGLEIPSRLNLSKDAWISPELLNRLPDLLNEAQELFEGTGGLHASALFSQTGEALEVKEDVGRHNALDKLVGARLKEGLLPSESSILMLSGRISYELVQKAAFAGIPAIAGLGAPSTMAVEAARAAGLTLIGFLTSSSFNVYSGGWRLEKSGSN